MSIHTSSLIDLFVPHAPTHPPTHLPTTELAHPIHTFSDFFVKFDGPAETPYENGPWKVHVTLPADYPFKVRQECMPCVREVRTRARMRCKCATVEMDTWKHALNPALPLPPTVTPPT